MQKRTAQALSRTALFGADSPAEPPHEFLIWSYGTVETTKGDLDFTRVDADRIVAEWQRQGNDLPLDYGHGMAAGTDAADPAEAGKAAGWFALEARDDGLWAVRVRWTEAAAAKLSAKEYRYFSPWIALDDDGRVAELFNLALTNIPATLNQRPLMAADKRGTSMMRKPRDGAARSARPPWASAPRHARSARRRASRARRRPARLPVMRAPRRARGAPRSAPHAPRRAPRAAILRAVPRAP